MRPDDPPEPGSYPAPANDNDSANGPDPEALRKLYAVALRLARIIADLKDRGQLASDA